jgi:hypothetical protein
MRRVLKHPGMKYTSAFQGLHPNLRAQSVPLAALPKTNDKQRRHGEAEEQA